MGSDCHIATVGLPWFASFYILPHVAVQLAVLPLSETTHVESDFVLL